MVTSPGRGKGQRSSRKKLQFPCVNHGFPCSICSNMAERENIAGKGQRSKVKQKETSIPLCKSWFPLFYLQQYG